MKHTILLLYLFVVTSVSCAQMKPEEAGIVLQNHSPADLKETIVNLNQFDGIQVTRKNGNTIYFTFSDEDTRLTAMHSLFNRSFQITQLNGLPIDFPILPQVANDEDQNVYTTKKNEWIDTNPQRYQDAQQLQGTLVISQDEFNALPEAKQQFILNHPDNYTIEP